MKNSKPPSSSEPDGGLDGALITAPLRTIRSGDDSFSAEDNRRVPGLGWRRDMLLVLPPALWFSALVANGESLELAPYVCWLLITVIWMPLILHRVAGRAGDQRRASAILAIGLLLWPPVLPVWAFGGRLGLLIYFPVLCAWGAGAMLIAGREKPPQRSPRSYARLLRGGAVIYGLVALGLGALGVASLGGPLGVFDFILALGLAAPAGLAAIKLAEGAGDPPPQSVSEPPQSA